MKVRQLCYHSPQSAVSFFNPNLRFALKLCSFKAISNYRHLLRAFTYSIGSSTNMGRF